MTNKQRADLFFKAWIKTPFLDSGWNRGDQHLAASILLEDKDRKDKIKDRIKAYDIPAAFLEEGVLNLFLKREGANIYASN